MRARRLPHRVVHSAQHHHAGEAADPEQHLRDRHPVSGLYSFSVLSLDSFFFAPETRNAGEQVANDENKTGILCLMSEEPVNTHAYILTSTYKIPSPVSSSDNIPLMSVQCYFILCNSSAFTCKSQRSEVGSVYNNCHITEVPFDLGLHC